MRRKTLALGAALMATGATAPAAAQVSPLPPSASTCQVTPLDSDSVRVGGTVDPNSLATTYRVEYGLNGLLDLSSPSISVGSAPDPTAIATQVDSLVPGGTYSCRIVALNAAGETAGSTTTFIAVTDGDGSDGADGAGSDGASGAGAAPSVNPATGEPAASGSAGAVTCTITGTAGRDRLKGTKGDDVICGLGGPDRITGLAGDDILIGGGGNDRIHGGTGDDRLLGNAGNDRMFGSSGADRLEGGSGRDFLVGAKGRDRITGGSGNDRLVASRDRRGGDRINGGKGRDRAMVNRRDRKRSIERSRVR